VLYVTAWRRTIGWLIEFAIITAMAVVGLLIGSALYADGLFVGIALTLTAIWLYFAGSESSSRQTTVSGRLLGTRVTGLRGEALTFNRATARHFAMYLSALTPFLIGYLMAYWTKKHQTLHDYISSTVVVKR
jgi:uncharacterized RDD family membrane protein YckC